MSSFEKNLSEGNVAKQLILFSLPFLASNIIQSLYSVADMLIVGRFSGTTSMSGVNLGSQVTLILTNIVVGLCAGGTVLIAQYLGAKRRKDMQETTATLLTTLTMAAIAITVLMLILKKPILHLIQTPAESFAEADRYLTVTVLGLIFIFGYNVFSAVMRGMGDPNGHSERYYQYFLYDYYNLGQRDRRCECIGRSRRCGEIQQFCSASGCGDGRFHFNHVCTKYWCRQMGQSG